MPEPETPTLAATLYAAILSTKPAGTEVFDTGSHEAVTIYGTLDLVAVAEAIKQQVSE